MVNLKGAVETVLRPSSSQVRERACILQAPLQRHSPHRVVSALCWYQDSDPATGTFEDRLGLYAELSGWPH